MNEKNFKGRIVHKHGSETAWKLATNFIPLQGEIVVYDRDANYNYERFKIGDGITKVNDLPFATEGAFDEKLENCRPELLSYALKRKKGLLKLK